MLRLEPLLTSAAVPAEEKRVAPPAAKASRFSASLLDRPPMALMVASPSGISLNRDGLHLGQKMYFSPNWISRLLPLVPVTTPNEPVPRTLPGLSNCGLLNALKKLARNSSLWLSRYGILKAFARDRSNNSVAGPNSMFLGAFPYSRTLREKAAVLNQRNGRRSERSSAAFCPGTRFGFESPVESTF